ncbi:MAG: ATP-binding protein [Roseivirga sp.]|nr:ATP-binding protein [Roseivirga sp.]
MDLQELKRLISRGEGQYLEFKKKANHPEKIIKELVAFANSKGGLLVLGVDDDGTLSGTRSIEGEVFILEDAIAKSIRPRPVYKVEIIKLNEKKGVALFHIEEGKRKPYFVKLEEDTGKGRAYVRSGEESLQASREMREIIRRRLKPGNIHFEYGEKEKVLMQYLEEHESIQVNELRRIAQIPKFVASRTLVRLVLANVLDVKPSGSGDLYYSKTLATT